MTAVIVPDDAVAESGIRAAGGGDRVRAGGTSPGGLPLTAVADTGIRAAGGGERGTGSGANASPCGVPLTAGPAPAVAAVR
mgnify:CR=1 FL=1